MIKKNRRNFHYPAALSQQQAFRRPFHSRSYSNVRLYKKVVAFVVVLPLRAVGSSEKTAKKAEDRRQKRRIFGRRKAQLDFGRAFDRNDDGFRNIGVRCRRRGDRRRRSRR